MRPRPHLARLTLRVLRLEPDLTGALATLAPEVFDAPPDPDLVARYLADPAQAAFLALDGDLVVGQIKCALHRHPEKPPNLYIEELGVSPGWQRRGIAGALMAAAEAFADAEGCAEIWLAAELENTPANAFYRAAGFSGQQVMMWSRLLRAARP